MENIFVNRILETMAVIIARSLPFMSTLISTMIVGKILSGGSMEQTMGVIMNAIIRGSIAFVAEVDDTLIVRSAEALVH
jgi:hypothetical protein